MPKVCEILIHRDDKQVVGGRFVLDGGKLTFEPEAMTAQNGETLMAHPAMKKGHKGEIHADKEPALWFEQLESTYSSTYVRARMLK